ncbi:MAG: hypothetical protein ACRDHN_07955 [Thermomicrobiales bacterium]
MTIHQHAEVFYEQPVTVFESPDDWEGPNQAYRISNTWDDKLGFPARLDQFVAQNGIEQLQALVIGAWFGDDSSHSSADVVKLLVKHRDKLS